MAAWQTLKDYIDLKIADNLPAKISADDDHNPTLQLIVDTFGLDYIYSGIATKTFVPIDDDKNRMYIAYGSVGTYVNFLDDSASPLTLSAGEFAIFKGLNNVWIKQPFFPNSTFLTPDDTPNSYASKGGYTLFANEAEDGLEFIYVKKYTTIKDDNLTDVVLKLTDIDTGEKAVPYVNATENLDLGAYDIIADNLSGTNTGNQNATEVDLDSYSKPELSSEIGASDDIQTAIGKLEIGIDEAKVATISEVTSASTNQLTIANGTTTPEITVITAAVADGETGLVTGDAVHNYIINISLAHANMYLNTNATEETPIADKELGLINFVIGEEDGFEFEAGETGTFSATADFQSYETLTVGGHNVSVGDYVVISQSSSNGSEDITGNYEVTAISETTFNILYPDHDASEIGVWQLPSQLKLTKAGILDVDFVISWNLSASASGTPSGDVVDWACWLKDERLVKTVARRTLTNAGDWGSFGGGAIIHMSTNDVVYMTLLSDDTNNITHVYGSLRVYQLDQFSHEEV